MCIRDSYDSYVSFRAIGPLWGTYLRVDCRAGVFAHIVTPRFVPTLGEQYSRHENHLSVDSPGVRAECMRLTNIIALISLPALAVTLTCSPLSDRDMRQTFGLANIAKG